MYKASKFLLPLLIFHSIQYFRLTNGAECVTNKTDKGSQYIQQLKDELDQCNRPRCQDAVDRATCQLVEDTTFADYSSGEGEVFDFIVVGGGTAGSVVASRLSENRVWRVLLLEAGGGPTLTTEVPGFESDIEADLFWPYVTEMEPNSCQGNKDKRCGFSKGKVLGGSSTVNGMGYLRGHPMDFDNWERMGNPGWGYKHMLPYFKKSEDLRTIDRSNLEVFKYHSVGGLLKIELFNSTFKSLRRTLTSGFEQLGYPSYNDVNAQYYEGTFPFHGTLKNARRQSTAKAFLNDFQGRPNLKISLNSLVNKVLIDNNNIAFGVVFAKNEMNISVRASKEVIVCAGVVGSPQILMLSGVGPAEHLSEMGIGITKDLPVGFNFHDHVQFLGYIINSKEGFPKQNETENALIEYLLNASGLLTEYPLSFVGFVSTGKATYPNIQFFVGYIYPNSVNSTTQQGSISGLDPVILRSIRDITSEGPALLMGFAIVRPKSRGRILLKTNNIVDYPLIYPRFLTVEDDVRDMLEGIEFLNRLIKTPAFKAVGASQRRIGIPECDKFQFQSEAYWRCTIKYMSFSYNHAAGSCKMGPKGRRDSVVDPLLRVIGVGNLRVVDASIMPTVTSKNTMAPVIAIAEKASDMIRQGWRQP